jgi:DNA polymerase I
MSKIVIIDGNSLLFRAFYATSFKDGPILHTSFGTPTNAIVAFSNMLSNILKTIEKDDGIFVAFDKGSHTFRHQAFKEYKANRKKTPEELLLQMPIARELLKSLSIPYYESDEIEADDIAGIMAKKAGKDGYSVEIYTSDHDYLQLIDENIKIELIKKGLKDIHEMNLDTFHEEYGIEPIQITDLKGLLGDSSDNIPGIPKVGEKTALALIKEHGDIENIIEYAKTQKSKVCESIVENQGSGRLSKDLATIRLDENISFTVQETIYKGYDFDEISEFAAKYELKNLVSRLPKDLKRKDAVNKQIEYEEVNNLDLLDLNQGFGFAIDFDTKCNYHDAELFGVSISLDNKVYYLNKENLLKDKKFLEILKNKNIKKYCFDFKTIYCVLNNEKIMIDGLYFDLLLANYLLDSSIKPEFENVMLNNKIDVSYVFENSLLFDLGNPRLSSVEAYYSLNLYEEIIFKLKEKDQYELLYSIEQPLTIVLAKMEIEGFPVDKDVLLDYKKNWEAKLYELEQEIYNLAGEKFNISSPKQLGVILFEKLKLSGNKKGSTSVEYLKDLIDKHPIVSLVLEYRKYAKLISTYVDGIINFIHEDGKIHTTFNQATTTTGRLSSSEPNMQNISVRDEEAKTIRKAFYYKEKDKYILSLDYSQIELRVLAHLSNSTSFINMFNEGHDIHSETAKKIFHIVGRGPTSLERRKAKAVNFGIVYGISDWGLAEQIDVSPKEAKEIISSFYLEFPEIGEYLNSLVEFAKTHGYATTMFNRRRYLEQINDPSYQIREFAKRAAMNAPIQGSAADLIKIAMIKIDDELTKNNFKSKLILQIHDEVTLMVYEDEKDKVKELVTKIMENCVKLKVNLKVDGGYAKTWFDSK